MKRILEIGGETFFGKAPGMFIAVDGYNFIKQSPPLREMERIELQKAREGLIEWLADYRRLKGHSITVVFDGEAGGRPGGQFERTRGIGVIFSKGGEKADDVLKRLAAEKKGGVTIVTSDREVAQFAERKGAAVLSVPEFAEKIELARWVGLKGSEERPERAQRSIAPMKRGPSHRLSKAEKKKIAARRKL